MPDRAPGDLSVVVHRDKTVLAAAVGARLCTAIADAQARRTAPQRECHRKAATQTGQGSGKLLSEDIRRTPP